MYRYIETVFRRNGGTVLAIGGVSDHIHALVIISPTISISEVVKKVKGSSSRFVSAKLRTDSWFGWQAHYGAICVCSSGIDTVKQYIKNQKQHHDAGTCWPEYEIVDEPDDSDIPDEASDIE